jgi:hypothetical protein
MSLYEILFCIILVLFFPIWATLAGVVLVLPLVFVYHIWGAWFDLIRGLIRDIKGYNK